VTGCSSDSSNHPSIHPFIQSIADSSVIHQRLL